MTDKRLALFDTDIDQLEHKAIVTSVYIYIDILTHMYKQCSRQSISIRVFRNNWVLRESECATRASQDVPRPKI